jgi:hypothetical protein
MLPKAQTTKGRKDELLFIKIKNFRASKKVKRQSIE